MKLLRFSDGMEDFIFKKVTSRIVERISFKKSRSVLLFFLSGMLVSSFAWSIEVTQGPQLIMDPNGVTPLTGVVQLTTDVPTRVTLTINNGFDRWSREFAVFQTDHYLPIFGLKPNSSYSIELTITDEVDQSVILSPLLQAVTGSLPVDFPSIRVLLSEPARMEGGFTLLEKFGRGAVTAPDGSLPRYTMIIDNSGNVVWYSTLGNDRGMQQLPNGNLFYRSGQNAIEVDLLGNERKNFVLGAPDLHHDLYPTKHGTFLSLSREADVVDGFPTSDSDPNAPTQTTNVRDEPVVELSPDGSLLNKWKLTDLIDPRRIGYNSLMTTTLGFDWAHANAVLYDPRDDSIIVSVRHQDAVIKFSRSTGNLTWILGNHDNWSPEFQPFLLTPTGLNTLEWQFHQHAPMVTPSGTLLLFDNGNDRASPFDGRTPIPDNLNYSRAVEYAINEETMEVQQIWEYGAQIDQRYFSSYISDADWMKNTGNVLITAGGTEWLGGVSSATLGMGVMHTRIVEVNHNTPAEKVFEVEVFNSTPGSRINVYRSERIPDLYPLDTDSDGIPDYQDNCVMLPNGTLIQDSGGNSQLDTDGDGFGNLCDADLNNDGLTNSLDLGLFQLKFFSDISQPEFDPDADFNGDGVVNSLDLGILKALFMQPPGPSLLTP